VRGVPLPAAPRRHYCHFSFLVTPTLVVSLRRIKHDKIGSVNMKISLSRRTFAGLMALATISQVGTWKSSVAEEAPLALKGYDPVAYFTDGKPMQGAPQFEAEWDHNRYQFANAEHRDLFKSDPAHYAPQFGNACTTTLSRGGFKEVDPQAWVIHDDKLYMFGGIAGVPMFEKDPVGYITKANQNRSVIPKS
jgi:YHS domain-containing protein